ncbi:MAG: hypothetical protein K1X54_08025 [Flavobacteriales bacterium]|nr:hypothetical protein [Flavobacteriales bacterium]
MKLPMILSWSVRILLAVAYVFSGILKLYPIEFFENDMLMHHLSTEKLVLFQSRLLIGGELLVAAGILFALHDKLFVRLSFLMLAIYTLYLTILLILEGNNGNCGCFGNAIVLTPFEGIMKNVFLAGMTWIVWHNPVQYAFRWKNVVLVVMSLFTLALPFILNPVLLPKNVQTLEGEKTEIPLEILYETEGEIPPSFDVLHGKKIIAFMLLKCPHCRLAATRLEAIKRDHPELPIYAVLSGNANDIPAFMEETKLHDIPYQHFVSEHKIMKVSGAQFPAIYLVDDKMLDVSLEYYDLNSDVLLEWYHRP